MTRKSIEISPVLSAALDRLYMDKRKFLIALRFNQSAAIEQFLAEPTNFGPLRSYVGHISLKANITRVRRLLQKWQAKVS